MRSCFFPAYAGIIIEPIMAIARTETEATEKMPVMSFRERLISLRMRGVYPFTEKSK